MSKFHRLYFAFVFLIWAIFHLASFLLPMPEWASSWVDDFLIVPLVLSLAGWIQSALILRKPFYWKKSAVVGTALFFGIAFELIIPKLNQAFTSDKMDILVYLLGASAFYLIQTLFKKRIE
ncbi:MAG: hypothetical protein LCH37_09195 [Bacteroidetes bacterium]|nr:hypothetical protein [Bacteroidota bacterium]